MAIATDTETPTRVASLPSSQVALTALQPSDAATKAAVAAAANAITDHVISHYHAPRKSSWLDSVSAKMTFATAAVAATLVTARFAISSAFFKTVNKGEQGAFHDLQVKRDKVEIGDIVAPARNNNPVHDAPERIGQISRDYDKALKHRKELLGFTSVFKEAKVLKRHQWMEVVFHTAAVASVAVGAILAITTGRPKVMKNDEMPERDKVVAALRADSPSPTIGA